MRTPHRPRNALDRTLRRAALLLSLCALGSACSVDRDLITGPSFKCSEPTDCVDGWVCVGATPTEPGICQENDIPGPEECADRDGDTFLAGADCPVSPQLDCDDTNVLIHPGQTDDCDGVNEDCDDETDEDAAPRLCDLQLGVCAGTTVDCVDGGYGDCADLGLYGPDYEPVAESMESCDGLDNNCLGPSGSTPREIDAHCVCLPGDSGPQACGADIGICSRGLAFCEPDGTLTDCVEAALGDVCVDDASCGEGAFCVLEDLDPAEDLGDGCVPGSADGCERRVCRALLGTAACDTDDDCDAGERCLEDACQVLVASPEAEACNGVDDNCDARIDEGTVCQPCPFGMVFVDGISTAPAGLCIDQYEASRPDATETNAGTFELYAVSRPGVLPWTGVDESDAQDICEAAEINDLLAMPGAIRSRRMCTSDALQVACGGLYPYGSSFEAGSCNDATTGTDVEPTGSYPDCCTDQGICDLSGNVLDVLLDPFPGAGFGGHTGTSDPDDLDCTTSLDSAEVDPDLVGFRCCDTPR